MEDSSNNQLKQKLSQSIGIGSYSINQEQSQNQIEEKTLDEVRKDSLEKKLEADNFFERKDLNQIQMVFKIIWVSFPNVFNFASLWILNFSNVYVTESFKEENYVNAYALSFMWGNALGFAVINCFNNGLSAMSAQAIGSNQYDLVSSYYQRSQALNYLILIFSSILMLNTNYVFQLFTDKEVADLSQEFMWGYVPSLFFYVIFDSTRNIFNAHKSYTIPNSQLLFTYSLHYLWVWLFMKKFDLQMFGLGLSRTITETINAILIISILKIGGLFKEIKLLWSKQAFKNWWGYIKFSIPMGSVLYLDWVASDLQTIFVSSMNEKEQFAGHSAFVSIFLLYVVMPLGLSITVITFMGQAIGKKDINQCKKISSIGILASLLITIIISIISFFLQDTQANFFTSTEAQNKYFQVCYEINNYFILHFQGLAMISGSILRVSGQQNIGFYVPLISYFIIGIPLQYVLVFTMELKLYGAWISYGISVCITAVFFTVKVIYIDWNKALNKVDQIIQKQVKMLQQTENKNNMSLYKRLECEYNNESDDLEAKL